MSIKSFLGFKSHLFLINHDLVSARFVVRTSQTEKRTKKQIENEDNRLDEIKKFRKETSYRISQLKTLIGRKEKQPDRKEIDLEKSTIKELRAYAREIKKEIELIVKVIKHLHTLIQREDLEVIYDTKMPLDILNLVSEQLRKEIPSLLEKKLSVEVAKQINVILNRIGESMQKLIKEIESFIKKSLDYYQNQSKTNDQKSLRRLLEDRTAYKRKINGMVQGIRKEIKKLTQRVKKDLPHSRDVGLSVLNELDFFQEKFAELVKFSILRVEAAEYILIGALTKQVDLKKELMDLKKEAETFFSSVSEQQNSLLDDEKHDHKKKWYKGRIKEFNNHKKDVKDSVGLINDEISKLKKLEGVNLKVIEHKVAKELNTALEVETKEVDSEKEEEKMVNAWVFRFSRKAQKAVKIGLLAMMMSPVLLKGGASINSPNINANLKRPVIEKEAKINDKSAKERQKKFKRLGPRDNEEVNQKKDKITKKSGKSSPDKSFSGPGFEYNKRYGSFIFKFNRKDVTVDLHNYSKIIGFDKITLGKTAVQKIPIDIKEKFTIKSLTADAEFKIKLKKNKKLDITCSGGFEINDGPQKIIIDGKTGKMEITSNPGENLDYAGDGLKKFFYSKNSKGELTDEVLLVDLNYLPDSFIKKNIVKKLSSGEISPEDAMWKLLKAQKKRAVYWGAPGVSDWDMINPVCNAVMRNMLYGIFGNNFFIDVKSNGISPLRSNYYWNKYFKKKKVYKEIKDVKLLNINDFLQKNNIQAKTGMIIQLKHGTSRHSVVVGKVTKEGMVKTIFTGYVSAFKKIKGNIKPTYDTGVGKIVETSILTDFSHQQYYVEGIVYTDELVQKLMRKYGVVYLAQN